MKEVLKKAVEHILSDRLDNEAQVKQAVILPILRALDWDDANPAEFVPEFPVDSGRVDYALRQAGTTPWFSSKPNGWAVRTTRARISCLDMPSTRAFRSSF